MKPAPILPLIVWIFSITAFLGSVWILGAQTSDSASPPTTPEEVMHRFQKVMTTMGNPVQQNEDILELAASVNEPLTRQTLDKLKNKMEPPAPMLYALMLARLVEFNPKDSATYALAVSNENFRSAAIAAVFATWAPKNPEAALAFISQMPTGPSRQYAAASALAAISKTNPDNANRLARQYLKESDLSPSDVNLAEAAVQKNPRQSAEDALQRQDQNARFILLHAALGEWTKRDRREALMWAETRPSQEDRSEAVKYVVEAWAKIDPAAAAHYAATLPIDSKSSDSVLSSVILSWARNDLPAALAFVRTLPDGQGKAQSYESILRVWIREDRNAAAAFALSLPPSLLTMNAVSYVMDGLGNVDLPSAKAFANKLATPEHQLAAHTYLEHVLKKETAPGTPSR